MSNSKVFKQKDIATKPRTKKIGVIKAFDTGEVIFVQCSIIDKSVFVTDVVMLALGESTDRIAISAKEKGCNQVFFEGNLQLKALYMKIDKGLKGIAKLTGKKPPQSHAARIAGQLPFITSNFVFAEDYKSGSDYDKFMRELTKFSTESAGSNNQCPAALSLLSDFASHQM